MDDRTPKWDLALQGLSHAEAESVHRRMRLKSYPPRTVLFQEGEPSDTLVVIRNGRVRLYLLSSTGEEFTLKLCSGGSILGLAAAVLRRPRILTAESIERVDASVMSVEDMVECMQQTPRFAINLTRLLAILAVENIERSAPLALQSAPARLGSILLALGGADTARPAGALRLDGLTQEDLAKMVGTTRSWVTLTLSDFEKNGLIQKQPGCIRIPDPDKFRRYLATRHGA